MDTNTNTGSTLFQLLVCPDDPLAWERFTHRYQATIRRWCRTWGSQDADADDICQTIMCKLLEQLQTFRYDPEKGKFRSWLKTVTRNTWINLRDKPQLLSLDDAACADWEEMMDQAWQQELFQEAIARVQPSVDEKTWRAFELYVLEGRSPEQVAKETDKSVAAVYMAKYRLTKKLTIEIAHLDNM